MIEFRDLDLDVFVSSQGAALLDEEEFAKRLPDYPASWIEHAKAASKYLLNAGNAKRGPFTPAIAAKWRAWIDSRCKR